MEREEERDRKQVFFFKQKTAYEILTCDWSSDVCSSDLALIMGHVNNIPTMQLFIGISRNTQSKSYMLSLTGCVWDFQNNALWDTHQYAQLFYHNGKGCKL